MHIIRSFIKKPVVIVLIAVVIVAAVFFFSRDKAPVYNTVTAERKDIVQEVSVTGRIEPAQSVELAFEVSGRVAAVNVKVGDEVSAGKILASLSTAELQAQLLKYQANFESEQAKLSEVEKGTRPEEIELYRIKVAGAKVNLEDAKAALVNFLRDAYTKSDDAVRSKADQVFANPQSTNPQLNLIFVDPQLENKIELGRFNLEQTIFPDWKNILGGLTAASGLSEPTLTVKKYLEEAKSFLDNVSLAVNNPFHSRIVNGVIQSIPDSWKTDVSAARTNVGTAVTNLISAYESFKTAESNLAVAESELKLKEAGATAEQIDSQRAKVKSALAEVENAQAQIAKRILRSPLNGVVTKMNAKIGEIAAANTVVASVISVSKFEIKAGIPEADIAKVKIGDKTRTTLDAYGEDVVFEAQVVSIEPAETLVENVAVYKTTLQFTQDDERIKSGMTANLDILTDSRSGVIIVPQRAIITRDGEKLVRVQKGETFEERKVTIGLRGSDGNIEITAGLKEGEKIIVP